MSSPEPEMRPFVAMIALACVGLSAQDPTPETALKQVRKLQEGLQGQFRLHVIRGLDPRAFKPDVGPGMKEVDAALARGATGEAREILLVARLDFGRMGGLVGPELNALGLQVRREVPGASRAWGVAPELLTMVGTPEAQEEALARNPDPKVRAHILVTRGKPLLRERNEAGSRAILARLERELPKEAGTAEFREAFALAERTFNGRPCPPFQLSDLEDRKVTHSLESFRGRYVLLDFWATWCGPCRREMPELHQAWERFKGPRFEMLSLSLDQASGDVRGFRKDPAQPMPWKHAFLNGGFDHPLVKSLGIHSIPRPVLLDPEGRIVAAGDELRGEDLLRTLGRILPR